MLEEKPVEYILVVTTAKMILVESWKTTAMMANFQTWITI